MLNSTIEIARGNHQNHGLRTYPSIRASELAKNTYNPIRSIVDSMKPEPNPEKEMIYLSIGDPTTKGNLKPHESIIKALNKSLMSMSHNGYAPSIGYPKAREAVAKYYSCPDAPLTAEDVILTSGCSHALDLCISALATRGQNILMPRPGFSLCRTLANGYGVYTKSYNLLPDREWEVDLDHLESQLDKNTAAIVVNNPSNPCGSVYTSDHLQQILELAEKHHIPIIADEIYDFFVFEGEEFIPLATLSKNVPILTCSGLTKRFLVPGWRMGWILIHDRQAAFKNEIRAALQSVSQRIIGSNTLVQGALPDILANTPKSFFDETISQVQRNAELAHEKLRDCPGLKPIKPKGAMYMMVGIDMDRYPDFVNEFQFTKRLASEESVSCLPGMCFDYIGYFRIVLTNPRDQMEIALERIKHFCRNYYQDELKPLEIQVQLIDPNLEIHNQIPQFRPNNAAPFRSVEPTR